MNFYRKHERHFLSDSEGHKYFFERLQMFKVKVRPPKRQKIEFSKFESSYHKNGSSYGQNCLGAMLGIKRTIFWHRSIFFDTPKIRKLSLKIGLF